MMADYKPCEQTCAKCGSADIYYRFRDKGERLDNDLSTVFEYAEDELIRCHCRTCGYRWNSLTAGQYAVEQTKMMTQTFSMSVSIKP